MPHRGASHDRAMAGVRWAPQHWCVTSGWLGLLGLDDALASARARQTYDVIILHGRGIDPESRLDAVRSLGVEVGGSSTKARGHTL